MIIPIFLVLACSSDHLESEYNQYGQNILSLINSLVFGSKLLIPKSGGKFATKIAVIYNIGVVPIHYNHRVPGLIAMYEVHVVPFQDWKKLYRKKCIVAV